MGSKKRKASKKKTKTGDGEDSNAHQSNSSSTHSHGSEERRSFDERESDGGEFEREEEEEKVEEEEAVDQLNGDAVKGEGLEEEVVQVEMEAKSDGNGSGSADLSSLSVEKEIHTLPGSDGVDDKEVTVVEEEQQIVPEFWDEIPKEVDYVFEAPVEVVGGFVEELYESVEEQIPGVESLQEVVSDVADSGFVKNAESVNVIDQWPEKIETEVASLDEDKSLSAPAVETSSKVDAVETLETGKHLEEKVIALDATTIDETDDVKNGEVQMQSHDNGVVNTSREVDNGKELDGEKQSEEKPLIDSTLPVRRTSWAGCCGLFEVFKGANR